MRRIFCCLSIVLLSGIKMYAQGSGAISGTITDPSGAVVPNAEIVISETATGYTRTASANTEGIYVVPSLRPADFEVVVKAPGFSTVTENHIGLLANQNLTLNFHLAIGASTSVTVESSPVMVDTSSASLKQVIERTRMVELPLNGRNAGDLTLLVPGVLATTSSDANQGSTKTFPGAETISANGSRPDQTSYLLDGGNFNDQFTNVNMPFPFPDALQEFSFQTTNYSTEYGQSAGGVVNVITRSGTNEFHGNAFDFLRNNVFDARNAFASKRDQLKRNQFGGTVGGPVIKDHTFFFFGYQGTRSHTTNGSLNSFVPTPANLNGDFSALLSATNPANPLGRVVVINDPTTNQPFPNNQIPVGRFDPASLGLVAHLPKAASGGSGQVFYSKPTIQNYDETVLRVDQSVRTADRFSFRWTNNLFKTPAVYSPSNILTYTTGSNIRSQNYLLHYTQVLRPNLLNEIRFVYARTAAQRAPATDVPNVADLGVQNIFQPADKAIQSISVSGFFSLGGSAKARFTRNDFSWSDDLRWVKGRHSISLGGYVERSRMDVANQFGENGTYSFSGDITGSAIADFMLGRLRTFTQGAGEFANLRNTFLGFYFQDDFRMNSRLALNAGLRYEPARPWHELGGRIQEFRLPAYYAGQTSQIFPNAPAGLFFPGDTNFPKNGAKPDMNNFAPRIGFAYDVFGNGRTSVRGGVGMFYESRQPALDSLQFSDTNPFSPQLTLTNPAGPFSNPLLGVVNPFPAPFPPPKGTVFPSPASAVTYEPGKELVSPLVYKWSLTVEHQLPGGWLTRGSYVGTRSTQIRKEIELDPAVYIPGSSLGPDQRRYLPGYNTISEVSPNAEGTYEALQLNVEKRVASGLTILANYTYSKNLDNLQPGAHTEDISGDIPSAIPWYFPGSNAFDKGPADIDATHRFVASYVWQIPGAPETHRVLRLVTNGWETSGILSAQTGFPMTILAGKDQSGTALGQDRANLSGNPYGPGACGTRAPCADYLNKAAFQLPALGTFGNLGKNSLRAPGSFDWDMGLFRNFAITERWQLQFRAEFFNALNHVNLGVPASSVSSGGFGSITSAADPRIGQLALKVSF
jgi:Carboxypeptidase regulatory-like domain/TonB-dependent Receptor Plug Domain